MTVAARILEEERPTREQPLDLSPFQGRVLAIPEELDVFMGGGRGGAKSWTLALLALRHAAMYGTRARALYLRRSFPAARDFESITRELYGKVHGSAASYNGSDHVWRFPGGGTLEIGFMDGPDDYARYHGRSFTLLLLDELAAWPDPALLDLLRGGLRSGGGVPVRVAAAANPGGVGHGWVARRYVHRAAPWVPTEDPDTGRSYVSAPSSWRDNPFLDRAEYVKQLEAATSHDLELRRAWLQGDWAALSAGAFFAGVLSEERSAVRPWPEPGESDWWRSSTGGRRWGLFARPGERAPWPDRGTSEGWLFQLAHDYGSSAPSVTFLVAESPGGLGPDGEFYPPGSVILVDELATVVPGRPSEGLGWPIPKLAEAIRDFAAKWRVPPRGVADDAIFARHGHSAGSITEEFLSEGVDFEPARKADRATGWAIMRALLADAGKVDVPGLYVSRSCPYFWETVPTLGRDPRRREDLDTRGPDHGADAARYACISASRGPAVGVGRVVFG